MNKADKSESEILRQKAEELVKERSSGSGSEFPEAENLKLFHELEVRQFELELQNEELTLAKSAAQEASEKYIKLYEELYEFAPTGYLTLSKEGKIIALNLSGADMLGKERSELKKSRFGSFVTGDTKRVFNLFLHKVFDSGVKETCEVALSTEGSLPMYVYLTGVVTPDGEQCLVNVVDITGRVQAKEYGEMSREILQILNEPGNFHDSIQRVLAVLKTQTRFDAVGIRLQKGDDFPYYAQEGFSEDFVIQENTLVERAAGGGICMDKDGKPNLECTCGVVITGKTDAVNSVLTPGGSFLTNDSYPLLFLPPEQDPRLHPRNQCIHRGYATVILVPLRDKNRIVGLIQLNDKRKGRFTQDTVEILEGIASQIGTALMRKQAEEALRESEERYRNLFNSMIEGYCIIEMVFDAANRPVDYRFLEINQAFELQTGLHEVQGKLISEIAPDNESYWYEIYGKVALTGNPVQFENEAKALSRWFDVSAFRVGGEDSRKVAICFNDITERKKAEEMIRENEERYRTLFEAMAEGFALCEIILDENRKPADLRYLMVNPAFERHTGLKTKDIIGRNILELFPQTERIWIERYGNVVLNGEPAQFEEKFGPLERWFHVNAYHAGFNRFAVVFTDITDRRKMELSLSESEQRLKYHFENSPLAVVECDADYYVTQWSREAERIFGWKKEETLGKRIDTFNMVYEEDIPIVNSTMERLSGGKEQMVVSNNRNYTKSGEVIDCIWYNSVLLDQNGQMDSVMSLVQDVTEHKIAEYKLNEAREKLNLALDNGNVGIWERDLKTNKSIWDKRTEKMFGFEEGTFDGTYETFEKCLLDEDVPHTREAIRKSVEENAPYETVFRVKLANGKINYINSKGLVTCDESGKAFRISGVCFDITDMKKGAEEALFKLNDDLLRSNKELEQFAYVASHDLQEPLRTVSTYTQLLAQRYKDILDDHGRKFIQFALEGALRSQGLINDLLSFSRVGTSAKEFGKVDFNRVYEIAIQNLSISIQDKNARVTCDDLPSVIGDEVQLVSLLQNLLGNALKFCKRTPEIHVSANESNQHYVFSVKDNGIGIEPRHSERIFLIFQRLVPRDEYGGTGIGLAICKRIVERHGGKIWIESQPGEGTTFYFTIKK